MSDKTNSSGGTVSTSTVGMWDAGKEVEDLRAGKGGK